MNKQISILFLALSGLCLAGNVTLVGTTTSLTSTEKPNPLVTFSGFASFKSRATFSSDERYFATFFNESVQLIDLLTGEERIVLLPKDSMLFNSFGTLQFRPDTHELYFVGGRSPIRIVIPEQGVAHASVRPFTFLNERVDIGVEEMKFSTDGKYLSLVFTRRHETESNAHVQALRVFDSENGATLLSPKAEQFAFEFSSDERSILYVSDDHLRVISHEISSDEPSTLIKWRSRRPGVPQILTVRSSPTVAVRTRMEIEVLPTGNTRSRIALKPEAGCAFGPAALSDSGLIAFTEEKGRGTHLVKVAQIRGSKTPDKTTVQRKSQGDVSSLRLSRDGSLLVLTTNNQEVEVVPLAAPEKSKLARISDFYELDPQMVVRNIVWNDPHAESVVEFSPEATYVVLGVPEHRIQMVLRTSDLVSKQGCGTELKKSSNLPKLGLNGK